MLERWDLQDILKRPIFELSLIDDSKGNSPYVVVNMPGYDNNCGATTLSLAFLLSVAVGNVVLNEEQYGRLYRAMRKDEPYSGIYLLKNFPSPQDRVTKYKGGKSILIVKEEGSYKIYPVCRNKKKQWQYPKVPLIVPEDIPLKNTLDKIDLSTIDNGEYPNLRRTNSDLISQVDSFIESKNKLYNFFTRQCAMDEMMRAYTPLTNPTYLHDSTEPKRKFVTALEHNKLQTFLDFQRYIQNNATLESFRVLSLTLAPVLKSLAIPQLQREHLKSFHKEKYHNNAREIIPQLVTGESIDKEALQAIADALGMNITAIYDTGDTRLLQHYQGSIPKYKQVYAQFVCGCHWQLLIHRKQVDMFVDLLDKFPARDQKTKDLIRNTKCSKESVMVLQKFKSQFADIQSALSRHSTPDHTKIAQNYQLIKVQYISFLKISVNDNMRNNRESLHVNEEIKALRRELEKKLSLDEASIDNPPNRGQNHAAIYPPSTAITQVFKKKEEKQAEAIATIGILNSSGSKNRQRTGSVNNLSKVASSPPDRRHSISSHIDPSQTKKKLLTRRSRSFSVGDKGADNLVLSLIFKKWLPAKQGRVNEKIFTDSVSTQSQLQNAAKCPKASIWKQKPIAMSVGVLGIVDALVGTALIIAVTCGWTGIGLAMASIILGAGVLLVMGSKATIAYYPRK